MIQRSLLSLCLLIASPCFADTTNITVKFLDQTSPAKISYNLEGGGCNNAENCWWAMTIQSPAGTNYHEFVQLTEPNSPVLSDYVHISIVSIPGTAGLAYLNLDFQSDWGPPGSLALPSPLPAGSIVDDPEKEDWKGNQVFVKDVKSVLGKDYHIEAYVYSIVPEPSSLILLGTGLVGVAGSLRRKLSR